MHLPTISSPIRHISKLSKVNLLLLATLLVAGTFATAFAVSPGPAPAKKCDARVTIAFERSSQVGVDHFTGSANKSASNISSIKGGTYTLLDNLVAEGVYTDVYGFASVAQRINKKGWWDIRTQDAANFQKLVIHNTPFKTGAHTSSNDAFADRLSAEDEGYTNWEITLQTIINESNTKQLPTHVVLYTVSDPTTNSVNTLKAIAGGGYFAFKWAELKERSNGGMTIQGVPSEINKDPEDINRALNAATLARQYGIKIIPIAIGNANAVSKANLQALAGPGKPYFHSENYGDLKALSTKAAQSICPPGTNPTPTLKPTTPTTKKPTPTVAPTKPTVPPTTQPKPTVPPTTKPLTPKPKKNILWAFATDTDGNLLSVKVNAGTARTINGPSWHGEVKRTNTNPNFPFAASWHFETTQNWRARLTVMSVPPGYVPVEDNCTYTNRIYIPEQRYLKEVDGSDQLRTSATLDNLPQGETVYCNFIFRAVNTKGIAALP